MRALALAQSLHILALRSTLIVIFFDCVPLVGSLERFRHNIKLFAMVG